MMNILLVSKLADSTLLENVLTPLMSVNNINTIFVLRDAPSAGVDNKVVFICPKKTVGNMRHLWKIVKGVQLCNRIQIDAIIGVLNIPHGYIGMVIHMLSGVPYIHITIAGDREFWIGGKLKESFNLLLFRKARFVTVTGHRTYDYLTHHKFAPEKLKILPNLPNNAFLEVEVSNTNRRYDVISFSRIDKNKNVQLLIKALAIIKNQVSVHTVIAGDGDEMENVKRLALDEGLCDSISFVGYISGVENKIDYYQSSTLFISCSKGEGFPVSMLEAMCCGCVPVVSNVGDIPDVINQWENGVIYEDTDNPAELAGILKKLLSSPELCAKMSAKAMEIRKSISVEKNSEQWDEMLSQIVKERE